MKNVTRILLVEHNLNDIEIIRYELKKGGINFISEVVQNEQDFGKALKDFIPDIILSDYSLPAFDGAAAFKMKEDLAPGTPFIFVSGSIGEENSIEHIKNGVTDYALKDKLFTLSTKVKRALKESKEKKQKNKTEQELIQSERRLARAQQVAHMGSWELHFDTQVVLLSEEACRIYGLLPDQNRLSLETWLSFIYPADFEFVSGKIKESRDSLRDFSFYHRIVHRDGSIRHIYSESKLEFDSTGKRTGLHGIAHDVTEMKQVEEQMEFERNNLASLINNTNDSMWSIDKDFKLITSNQPFDELAKLVTGHAIAKGASILEAGFSPERLTSYKRSYDRAFAGESFTEIEYTDNPVEFWSEISYYPIRKGDQVIGTACYSRDITHLKLAERERAKITNDLIQRNKDLEQFAYIVSHNLRSPVANIMGITDAIHSNKLAPEAETQMKEYLVTSVKKLDDVIKDLNHILQIKSNVSEEKETVHFSELLADIQLSIDSLVRKEGVQFITDFKEVDEMITLKSYLYSIFFNLISNSIKYRSPQTAPIIEITSRKSPTGIELVFKDNGLGIDLGKRREQVFGLYKRFHSHTEGKGMGLYMVKTQVETLGGKISIQSEVNKGTEFRIVFDNERRTG
jgi:PAS domain S-box-containing protein